VIKTRAAIAAFALAALAMGMSSCMQAINANAGYNIFSFGTPIGKSSGTSTNYLYYPRGIAVDSAGHIYVVDSGNNRIIEMNSINSPSSSWTSWTIPPISTTLPNVPAAEGIAVDPTGANIWIADSGNGRILHLTGWPSPSVTAYNQTTNNAYTFSYPVGLALYGNTLYVTDPGKDFPYNTPSVFKIDVSTGFVGLASTSNFGIGATHASFPRGIAVDSTGTYIYITDETNYRIIQMDSSLLKVQNILGTRGSGTGQFISPQTIALDSVGAGHIYVVDSANYWVVKMNDISGAGWTPYGVQSGTSTTSVYPSWVAVFSSSPSSIYVSDDINNQIAEFQ
jgi:hypothetical protein